MLLFFFKLPLTSLVSQLTYFLFGMHKRYGKMYKDIFLAYNILQKCLCLSS